MTEDVLVSSVTVSPPSKTLEVGESVVLQETVCPENAVNKRVTWSSSAEDVATVNPNTGMVTAQGVGTATITATAKDGSEKGGCCALTVIPRVPVTSVAVEPAAKTMRLGGLSYLRATVCPANATNQSVWWTSSDPCVASVSGSTGKIRAKAAGTTTITATTDGNFRACCTVTVTAADTPKPRSRFGSVVYEGEEYNIFVPNHLETTIDAVWEEVDRKIVSDLQFDWFSFIAGTEFHEQEGGIVVPGDFKGELKKSILCDSDMKPVIGVAGILAGILDAVSQSMNRIFIEFIFKKTSDNHKRVIIMAGSSDIKQVFTQLADGIPRSAYYSNAGSPLA